MLPVERLRRGEVLIKPCFVCMSCWHNYIHLFTCYLAFTAACTLLVMLAVGLDDHFRSLSTKLFYSLSQIGITGITCTGLAHLICTSGALGTLSLPVHSRHLHQWLTAQHVVLLKKSFQKFQEEHTLYSLPTKQAWLCVYGLRGK